MPLSPNHEEVRCSSDPSSAAHMPDSPNHEAPQPADGTSKTQDALPIQDRGIQHSHTVFVFWLCVMSVVSLLTISVVLISNFMPSDAQTEFFTMPSEVRFHSAKGKHLKLDLGEGRNPVKVFVREEGPFANTECVLLLHGLAASSFLYRHVIDQLASKGFHVIAFDFPGAGLSEKPVDDQWGLVYRVREIAHEILEKGLLWRFEQLFETGAFPDPVTYSSQKSLHYNAEELAESLAQVVNVLSSTPVHIVLHDTSVEAGLTFAIQNPSLVRSITLIDVFPGRPSFPAVILDFQLLRSLMSWFPSLQQFVLKLCCIANLTQIEAEYYTFLLKSNNGIQATLQTWKSGNSSFDVVSSIKGLGELPLQILWSNASGNGWLKLGESLSSRLHSTYITHSGGRWPQENAASEIAEDIFQFVASLPQTVHSVPEEQQLQYIQDLSGSSRHSHHSGHGDQECDNVHEQFDLNSQHDERHDHGHCLHDHSHAHHIHDHGLGYMEHMGHGGWVL